jgi:hypothetical protein
MGRTPEARTRKRGARAERTSFVERAEEIRRRAPERSIGICSRARMWPEADEHQALLRPRTSASLRERRRPGRAEGGPRIGGGSDSWVQVRPGDPLSASRATTSWGISHLGRVRTVAGSVQAGRSKDPLDARMSGSFTAPAREAMTRQRRLSRRGWRPDGRLLECAAAITGQSGVGCFPGTRYSGGVGGRRCQRFLRGHHGVASVGREPGPIGRTRRPRHSRAGAAALGGWRPRLR